LVELYDATNGSQWRNASNWLVGEPCVDGWHGVVCCPQSHPVLSLDARTCAPVAGTGDGAALVAAIRHVAPQAATTGGRRLQATGATDAADAGGSSNTSVASGAPVVPCSSGSVTGTVADLATCEVTGVFLPSNNLVGRLPASLFELRFVTHLVLSANSLTGELPASADYSKLKVVDVSSNSLQYPPPNKMLGACFSGVRCGGYPPNSCDAFGDRYVVRTDAPNECSECASVWVSLSAMIAVFVLFVLMLALYAYMVHKHDGLTTQGVSTAAIIITHMQTVSIISKLRLAWPPSTEYVLTVFANGLQLEGMRPECIFQSSKDVSFFHVVSITRVALPIACLSLCGVARILIIWLGPRRPLRLSSLRRSELVDKLERAETIVFQLLLVSSWRGSYQLIETMNTGATEEDLSVARTGAALAFFLLGLQVFYACKYAFFVWAVTQFEKDLGLRGGRAKHGRVGLRIRSRGRSAASGGTNASAPPPPPPTGLCARARRCVARSLAWTCGCGCCTSVRPPAKCVALRDGLVNRVLAFERRHLTLARLRVRTSYTCKRFDTHAPYWQFVVWLRQLAMTVVTLLPRMFALAEGQVEEDFVRGNADMMLWLQVPLAIATLLLSAVLHWRVKPFLFAFQNWLEAWLLFASMAMIALASVYSLTRGQTSGFVLEGLLTSTLALSMIAAAVYLCRHYRKEMAALAERQKENLRQMSVAVARGSAVVQREARSVRRKTVAAADSAARLVTGEFSGSRARTRRRGGPGSVEGVNVAVAGMVFASSAENIPPPPPPPPLEHPPAGAELSTSSTVSCGSLAEASSGAPALREPSAGAPTRAAAWLQQLKLPARPTPAQIPADLALSGAPYGAPDHLSTIYSCGSIADRDSSLGESEWVDEVDAPDAGSKLSTEDWV
jgi:hypothetical protein